MENLLDFIKEIIKMEIYWNQGFIKLIKKLETGKLINIIKMGSWKKNQYY